MILNLNPVVLNGHIQLYPNSCVPMAIELVLKLMNKVAIDYYELQKEKCNVSRWGGDFNNRIFSGTQINLEFDIDRGPNFPLNELFEKISSELDSGRFVNCAVKPDGSSSYHAYIIYGINDEGEFLGISIDYEKSPEYINDMKARLTKEQGSDILTFKNL